jgi:hypothetical protein
MGKQTISSLLAGAARLLRQEFEFIRKSNPHPGEKGEEVQEILKKFLNSHLPKRFSTSSGIIIDTNNNMSKQTDMIIYDTLSSPIYRSSETTQIIPYDAVAAVIEVKSCLNKKELVDAFEKIVSCKQLKKRPLSQLDQRPTGTKLTTIGTYGIIFGFDSNIKLKTLAEHMIGLNQKHESKIWPDMVIILDKGIIEYGISFPGHMEVAGTLAPLCDEEFRVFPIYVNMVIHKDELFSLNRFFCNLLSHLTFYPRRPSTPPFDVILEGTQKKATSVIGYQFNAKRELISVPPEMYSNPNPPISIIINDSLGAQIGILDFIPWQDGSSLRWHGQISLEELLSLLPHKDLEDVVIIEHSGEQFTSILKMSEDDFRKWPEKFSKTSLLKGIIVEDAH